MTSYTVTSERLRDYYSSKHRTANWVTHVTTNELVSPTIPPSELSDNEDGMSEVSEVESSHSIPPKLMLRYNDGRPDVIIPHVQDLGNVRRSNSGKRSPEQRRPSHSGSTRSHSSKRSQGHGGAESFFPPQPEDIRILPSHPNSRPQMHTRSRSLPRDGFQQMNHDEFPPQLSLHPRIISQPLQSPMSGLPSPIAPRSPAAYGNQTGLSPGRWAGYDRGHGHQGTSPQKNPPAIVYAPSHHSQQARYAPPAMYTHPLNVGPNGVVYSHSAPVPATQYRGAPYPSDIPSSAPPSQAAHHHGGDGRGRSHASRTRSHSQRHRATTPHGRDDDAVSIESGSTYYVIPNGRQKVHVVNTPDMTMYSSSTSTKSPTTPVSPGSFKRPFFQRLFTGLSDRFSSNGSSRGSTTSKRLHRRHSMERL